MQVLGSRRGGLITLIVAALALVVVAIFLVLQLAERPAVEHPTPGPGGAVSDRTPSISFAVANDDRVSDLRVTIDGRDRTARVRSAGGRLVVPAGRLAEGRHRIEVSFSSSNLFARSVSRSWEFRVDTRPPRLAMTAPAAGALANSRRVAFSGSGEPGTQVTIAFKGKTATADVDSEGRWRVATGLPEGATAVTATARDAAGNATLLRRRVTVDTVAPSFQISSPAKGATITETDQPLVYGRVPADNPRALGYTAKVNGAVVTSAKGSDAPSPDTGYVEAGATETEGFQIDGHDFAIPVGTLPQGRSLVAVSVTDAAGNVTRVQRVVTVDSTESFGAEDLRIGARGDDVKQLQERLREAGVFPKRARLNGRFDPVTQLAVYRYQGRFKLPKTKIVDQRTRRAMMGRIVVNLGQRTLRLIRNGRVAFTYPIAIGQPAYPTPTGNYEVNDKQVDPAWYPPDSPWAAELETIPPGPGNPLGTRWIGTTAPAIGVHGTYAEYTVGTAASHGCMRMKIADVEALFEQVSIGMQVRILP